ncbi:MAG: hypothetical protein ABR591_00580 [Candidatus Velthaea sp.]
MAFPDPARILRASKIRLGPLRARGVPAILFGAAGIVLAAGASRAIRTGAVNLPETVRELRNLIEAARQQPRKLNA